MNNLAIYSCNGDPEQASFIRDARIIYITMRDDPMRQRIEGFGQWEFVKLFGTRLTGEARLHRYTIATSTNELPEIGSIRNTDVQDAPNADVRYGGYTGEIVPPFYPYERSPALTTSRRNPMSQSKTIWKIFFSISKIDSGRPRRKT